MDFHVLGVDPPPPFWPLVTFLGIICWPLLGRMAVRRGSDLRLFSIVPLVIACVGGSFGVIRVVRFLILTGSSSPRGTAAGLAETLLAPVAGATMSTLIALGAASLPKLTEARQRRSRGTLPLLVLAAFGLSLYAVEIARIPVLATVTEPFLQLSRLIFAANVVVSVVVVTAALLPASHRPQVTVRTSLWILACLALVTAACLFQALNHFHSIALSGG